MTTLKEEIDLELKKHLDKWKYVPTMMEIADITIKVIEKRIDSIEYLYDMEWHCENAVDYVKNEMKEMLK